MRLNLRGVLYLTLSADRRALHRIPELDWQLPQTAAYLRSRLEKLPCSVFEPCENAVCAYFDFGREQTTAFRSDMDALPVTEATGLPFTSEHVGRMHACGHDGHMAIVLGLADRLAAQPAEKMQGNVLLIFEPAEETTGGAAAICESGVLEAHHVTSIYGLHLWPELPMGTVASCAGGMMARSCELTVVIEGKSAHIARWREGNDALFAALRFTEAVYALAERERCVLRFGKLESGTVCNAVSDRSVLRGSLRCWDDAVLARLLDGMNAAAEHLQVESGCVVTIQRSAGYPPVTNDAALLERARRCFAVETAQPTFITEDFSFYQKRTPGVFFWLGTRTPQHTAPLHSPQFDFDERVLETGVRLFLSLL